MAGRCVFDILCAETVFVYRSSVKNRGKEEEKGKGKGKGKEREVEPTASDSGSPSKMTDDEDDEDLEDYEDIDNDDDEEPDEDAALLTSYANFNRLLLVLRDEGVLRFVKYVSAAAQGSRWDICGEFEVGMIQDESEQEGEEEGH